MKVDLVSATQAAVYAALAAAIAGPVYDDAPAGTEPPFHKIGKISSENVAGKGEQLEKLTVEIQAIYRGGDRGVLIAMLHAARVALDDVALTFAEGINSDPPRWLDSHASDAGPDGVTFAGIANFELYAEPA